jgi:UDPglucose--hexose-1-phosphate uridylyltransferase
MLLKPASEIRKDYFLDKYVVITPGRARRPRDLREDSVMHRDVKCGLCPEGIEKNLIIEAIGGKKNWDVMVLKNKFPAVTLKNSKAFGTQEVIVETPEHGKDLHEFSLDKIEKVLNTYRGRVEALSKLKKLDYILIFKNNGSKAGASLAHSHSQVFATQILPPLLITELEAADRYKSEHGSCPYCDILKKESKSKRLVYQDDHIVVFTPYASEYHYELWFTTRRHLDNITDLSRAEIKSLAYALKKALIKLHLLGIPYNFFTQQVVSNPNQHFYLKLQPRDSVWAGVEISSGLIINSVPPEEAAKYYKK